MKTFEEKLKSYAELVVKVGLNVQPNQVLYVRASVDTIPFARAVTHEAYNAGAKNVYVDYIDPEITLSRYLRASDDVFTEFPEWERTQREKLIDKDAAFLFIVSEDPDLLSKVDPNRIANYQKVSGEAMVKWREQQDDVSWVICAAPSQAWADKVFTGETNSLDKLWDAIFNSVRVGESEPVMVWKDHIGNLLQKATYLNEKKYKKLHYKAEGTDLSIELHPRHLWRSGGTENRHGVPFVANMPTEEVFTSPLRSGVNGVVSSKKPLSYAGNLIDEFKLTFENGRIVDVTAKKGEEVLKNLVQTDEGSHYLGEIALVPHDSPISNTNILFLNTLFDENAANHLALGFGFPNCIEDGENMTKEQLKEVELNSSITHVDFMIGCADMEIDGELPDGTREPIFRKGNWAF
ncbi:aminopeptidase [Neobacillus sp. OS1-2]|uniref:aminopeptidase n=1 Tax=Neobacillus sp. OS1-2 TaxID=3070680 RepID=UPI0027E05732|nr:aminopeptidase [Neobacillus sp. OS1-2]WML39698.1 aminopeptidase [Neobacillus sp. OS1-2]